MRAIRLLILNLLVLLPPVLWGANAPAPGTALVLEVSGAIGPATADYLTRGLQKAAEDNVALVVIKLDTPGGLDSSMRRIIQAILASPVPVATYVAPAGARAASAGTYILLASPIAAMAPATSVGAATPVQVGGVPDPGGSDKPPKKDESDQKEKPKKKSKPGMDEKMLNDSIAYIKGLAQMHGRNTAWADKAVREAATLTAEEAVKQNVADLMAQDVPELLKKINGKKISLNGRDIILKTDALVTKVVAPDWRAKLLAVITDPNVAYILMMLGIYGIFFELWNPGFVLPGVIGGICLLLALYAFQVLPVNFAGLALVLLGVAFMVAEVFMPSFGALGIGGVVALAVGSVILLDTDAEGMAVAWPLVATVAVASAVLFLGAAWFAVKARAQKVLGGAEELIGALGEVLENFEQDGRVRVQGEEWQARANAPVQTGQTVKVIARDGLTLTVTPISKT